MQFQISESGGDYVAELGFTQTPSVLVNFELPALAHA